MADVVPGDATEELRQLRERLAACEREIQELRAAEARSRTLLDSASDFVAWRGADGRFLYISPSLFEATGWTLEDMQSPEFRRLMHPEDLAIVEQARAANFRGQPTRIEFRLPRRDGSVLWVDMQATPRLSPHGQLEGVLIIARDITERKLAQEALQASERRFRALVEDAFDAVSIIDAQGNILYETPTGVQLLGGADLPLGRNGLAHIHPDDVLEARRLLHQLLLRPEAPVRGVELRVRRPNHNEYHWLEASARNRLDDPAVGGIVVNWRDITERKQVELALRELHAGLERLVADRTAELKEANQRLSVEILERKRAEQAVSTREELLRLLMDSIPAYIAYIDDRRCFRWVNRGCELFFGRPREEMIGQPVRQVVGEAVYRDIGPMLDRALSGEMVRFQRNFQDEEGNSIYHQAIYTPHLPDTRLVVGCFAVVFDVTDLRQAETRVRQLQADVAHANRLSVMGEMASGLAHEVNQPLAAIANYAAGALRRLADGTLAKESLTKVFEHIAQQAERAGEIIRRLRAFIRRAPSHRGALHINDAVREAVLLLENDLGQSGVQLQMDLAQDLPVCHADQVQLVQVILNLARNALEALDATPREHRQLQIATELCDGHVRVIMRDNGSGLDPKIAAFLFQPFHTTKPQGMGMGLPISRSIIEAHAGQIEGRSNPEGGATFSFSLPAN
jgi:PAS domain S-box-containing protein